MASKLNLPKATKPMPAAASDTGPKELDLAKLENSLAVARVKVLGDAFNTIGKGFDYLRAKKDSEAIIAKAHADIEKARLALETTRLQVDLGHHALDKLEEIQEYVFKILEMLIDEAGQSSDFEGRRRIIADANESLRTLATIRLK
ncbi:hypothetical protein CHU95_03490 [Niveispirillum lacus]|uniref:Uncharacterized protein n=1 Tax=Niveispirillum lacus TaxID=1981099 RepID=A0A255Z7F8_9PROT|nr:hypothetical protein [Niveispirillum lacus]OYQ36844.1 hypothetical protein CHU95_03490 [Niveispirillum lacus]